MDSLDRHHFRTTSIGSSSTTATTTAAASSTELFICFTSMKLSKSILSPARAASDGAPSLSSSLSRRLRTNGSLKSGHGQASPFFTNPGKKRGCGFENPEPSSPKVTCIGQVRVRTKKKVKQSRNLSKKRNGNGEMSFRKIEHGSGVDGSENHRNQKWVHLPVSICEALKTFGCKNSCFSSSREDKVEKESGCGTVFCRWLVSMNDGEGGKRREIELVVGGADEAEEEETTTLRSSRRHVFEDFEVKEGDEEADGVCVPPPKNALLLMRCRSDPMKMADLANRFKFDSSGIGRNLEFGGDEVASKVELLQGLMTPNSRVEEIGGNEEFMNPKPREVGIGGNRDLEAPEEETEVPETESQELINPNPMEEDIGGDREFQAPDEETLELQELMREEEIRGNQEVKARDEETEVPEVELQGLMNPRDVTIGENRESEASDEETDVPKIELQESINPKEDEISEEIGEELEEIESNMSSFEALLEQESSEVSEDCTIQNQEEEEEEEGAAMAERGTGEEQEVGPEVENGEQDRKDIETPVLPDCLLLMMREPKLSMEVSKETWVCSTDFMRWLPERPRKSMKGGGDREEEAVKRRLSVDSESKKYSPRLSCSLPAAVAMATASVIERKVVKAAVGYEPLELTRCKSEPMRTAAAKLIPESCWKNSITKMVEHRRVGAAGVGF